MKNCIKLLLFILLQTTNTYSFNVQKLETNRINIQNKTTNKQQILVTTKQKCPTCSNKMEREKIYSLEKNEQIVVTNIYGKIEDIFLYTCNNKDNLIYYNNNQKNKHILQILHNAKNCNGPTFPFVSFDKTMQTQAGYIECIKDDKAHYYQRLPKNITPSAYLNKLKNLYEKFIALNNFLTKPISPKIPRVIHQLWFGITGEMPNQYKQWQKEWKKKHSEWKLICWNEEMIQQHFPNRLLNQATFDKAKSINHYAEMADIARYEIIEKFGGLYVDCDTKCFEPFDFLHNNVDFYAPLEGIWYILSCGNGIFGAKPHHPVMQACIKNIKNYEKKPPNLDYIGENPAIRSMEKTFITTGPGLMTISAFQGTGHDDNIDIVLPSCYFSNFVSEKNPMTMCFHDFFCDVKKQNLYWRTILTSHYS